jgi:hypothetical protein
MRCQDSPLLELIEKPPVGALHDLNHPDLMRKRQRRSLGRLRPGGDRRRVLRRIGDMQAERDDCRGDQPQQREPE